MDRARGARSLACALALVLGSCREREAPRAVVAAEPPAGAVASGLPVSTSTGHGADASVADATARARPWVALFYPGWAMAGRPPSSVDLAGVDDVVLFGLVPQGTGITAAPTGLTDARVAAAASAARAAGAHVLVSVGGERTGARFRAAMAGEAWPLAESIAAFVARHRLDGVVLDIEPLSAVEVAALDRFVDHLRVLLRETGAARVEAVVAPEDVGRIVPLAASLDRVSIMTYLGTRTPDEERDLARALVDAGLPAAGVGLGVDARTPPADAARRVDLARRRETGGLVLWHATTLCRPDDAGARCALDARALPSR